MKSALCGSRVRVFLAALAIGAFLTVRAAEAGSLMFSYYYTGAGTASAGFLTTTDTLVAGNYTILGIQGLRNTEVISGLVPAGGFAFNDNLLNPSAPYLTPGGTSYTAGGASYNIYTNDFGFAPCNDLRNWETSTGFCGTEQPITLSIQPFTPTAGELYFAYTYTGAGVASAGILTTTDVLVGGNYTTLGIEGLRNAQAIAGLVAPGGFAFNDNLLNPSAPYLTPGGMSYTAGGANYNIYTNSFGFAPCNDLRNWETSTGFCGSEQPITLTIQSVHAVPEPATVALLGSGIAALAGRRRRRRV